MAWKKTVEEKVVDKWFEHVKRLLRELGRESLLAPPPKGFGVGAIKKAVKVMVERVEDPEELDWRSIWRRLNRKRYDTMEDFIKDMEAAKLLPPPTLEEKVEEEAPPETLNELLEKMGIEPLPPETDPYYPIRLEEAMRELATRLEEAEKIAGKVKLRVKGKTVYWGAGKVTETISNLYRKIRDLEAEKQETEKKLKAEIEKLKRFPKLTVEILKETPAIVGADMNVYGGGGLGSREPFRKGQIVTLPKPNAESLIAKGLAKRWGVVEKPVEKAVKPAKELTAHVKLEVTKNREYWVAFKYDGQLIISRSLGEKFSDLIRFLETGEETVDLYYTMMRQIGDEEMVREELKRYPYPFNTEQVVKAYWSMDDVTWDYKSREDYRIWKTTYSEAELSGLTVEELKRVAKVKLGKTYPTKKELIDAILGRTVDVLAEEVLAELERL